MGRLPVNNSPWKPIKARHMPYRELVGSQPVHLVGDCRWNRLNSCKHGPLELKIYKYLTTNVIIPMCSIIILNACMQPIFALIFGKFVRGTGSEGGKEASGAWVNGTRRGCFSAAHTFAATCWQQGISVRDAIMGMVKVPDWSIFTSGTPPPYSRGRGSGSIATRGRARSLPHRRAPDFTLPAPCARNLPGSRQCSNIIKMSLGQHGSRTKRKGAGPV